MIIIEAKCIKKYYKTNKLITEVLKGIDLNIEEGEFVSIVGPSGSGKTTLLNVLSGLDNYTDGILNIFNKEISSYSNKEKANLRASKIGFIFQFYNLIPNLTVYENILLASIFSKRKSKMEIRNILEQVKMSEYIDYYPNELSGGMQQRVAIARCLINNPKIIFADEPIGNLDYDNGIRIMEILEMLNKTYKKTIIMVTHNEDTTKYGTRTIHMLDGKVILDEKHN